MDDLSAPRILRALDGTRFRHVQVHAELGSTQSLLVEQGGRDGHVVVADQQTAGRGRAGRSWVSLPGKALLFSVLLRGTAPEHAPLVGLAAGLAVARAVEDLAGIAPGLKWPNDVLVEDRKLCGILGEVSDGDVVLGVGVNVHHAAEELPPGVEAASIHTASGRRVRRDDLLVAILRDLDASLEGSWMDEYRRRCVTIGRMVRAELATGLVEGEATAVEDDGALVVDGRRVLAGDVVHLRNARKATREG